MCDDVINNFDQEWKHTCVNTSQKCRYNKAQSDWLQTTDQWDLVWTFFIYSKFNKSGVVSLGDKLFRGAGVGAVPAGPIRGVGAIFVGGFVVGTDGAFRRTFAMSAKFSSLALEYEMKNQNSKKSFFSSPERIWIYRLGNRIFLIWIIVGGFSNISNFFSLLI